MPNVKRGFKPDSTILKALEVLGLTLAALPQKVLRKMGATLAGGIAGAKVGSLLGPIGAGVGALVGGAAAKSLPFFYGMNREKTKEAIDRGLKTEVDEGAAAAYSHPTSYS